MPEIIEAKELGLPARTVVERLEHDHYALVMGRRSRIIMADGKKIVAKAEIIRAHRPGATVRLKTAAPVCSKTLALLSRHGIAVEALSAEK